MHRHTIMVRLLWVLLPWCIVHTSALAVVPTATRTTFATITQATGAHPRVRRDTVSTFTYGPKDGYFPSQVRINDIRW